MSRSELPPCHSAEHGDESADTFSEKPCCEDHHAAVEAQDTPTILKKGDDLLPPVKFLAAFTYAFFQSQLTSGDKGLHCSVYRPPLVPRDIPVLIQSFLRSEEHTSELQSLMRISYAVFCLKQKNTHPPPT